MNRPQQGHSGRSRTASFRVSRRGAPRWPTGVQSGGKSGRGVELARLFLSCLVQAKLQPVYVQLNQSSTGHALAAVWITTPAHRSEMLTLDEVRLRLKERRLLVLECTGFVKGY